jgi:hypothetical protein
MMQPTHLWGFPDWANLVTGGLNTFGTAARCCRLFDEIRAFSRPQAHRHPSLTLAQRRDIHRERWAHLMGIMGAA